jgi:hypothetical protein
MLAFATPLAPEPGADPRPSFVALLPAIETRIRSVFHRLRRYHDREGAVTEVVARARPTRSNELVAGIGAQSR